MPETEESPPLGTCAECEKQHAECVTVNDGNTVCLPCKARLYRKCKECSEYERRADMRDMGDRTWLCEPCHDEHYHDCTHCGATVADGDHGTMDGDIYCSSCCDELGSTCISCEETVRTTRTRETYDNERVCRDCASGDYYTCDSCGGLVHCGDSRSTEDSTYCPNCYEDQPRRNPPRYRGQSFYDQCYPPKFDELPFDRRYGVELEAENETEDNGVFQETDDGSIDGKEYVSPIMQGDGGLEAIRALCETELSADEKCGFHLHLDARDLSYPDVARVAALYQRFEPLFFSLVRRDRPTNHYCRPINTPYQAIKTQGELSEALYGAHNADARHSKYQDKRYEWVNVHSYMFRGTLEIRLHEGTFDPDEIVGWIKLNQAFLAWAIAKETRGTLEQMLPEFLGWFPDVKEWVLERMRHHKNPGYDRLERCLDGEKGLVPDPKDIMPPPPPPPPIGSDDPDYDPNECNCEDHIRSRRHNRLRHALARTTNECHEWWTTVRTVIVLDPPVSSYT